MSVCKWCNKKVTRKCLHCGKEFEPKTCRQVYCTDSCRLLAFRHRKKWLEQKLKHPERQKEEECSNT